MAKFFIINYKNDIKNHFSYLYNSDIIFNINSKEMDVMLKEYLSKCSKENLRIIVFTLISTMCLLFIFRLNHWYLDSLINISIFMFWLFIFDVVLLIIFGKKKGKKDERYHYKI